MGAEQRDVRWKRRDKTPTGADQLHVHHAWYPARRPSLSLDPGVFPLVLSAACRLAASGGLCPFAGIPYWPR
ncbi:uncharacterized protein SPSK_01342 [Sporothrix schenckii 1099-18]|uniref:Uncharacterized protein n=1 Tax=Sporothrix schenckii 1099-18 TaxID=1397361 RepID=A0A0F2LY95_SPOSC|nr:uncharacterized protein SPSK_01342 [Sporothrix schenckii 1099-18]KJR81445.1 hypothetical protein SPSK_01342 [Sporothrix schenckii 1099-18]